MQSIKFTTSAGSVVIDDRNSYSAAGERIFRLNDFDGNSAKTRIEAVNCINMPGQRVLETTADVKTVIAKISFAPVYYNNGWFGSAGDRGMYALRREVLRRFPLGAAGELVYTNDMAAYSIRARVDQIPVVTVKDGNLCECTIMFTCDYPYWSRAVDSSEESIFGSGTHLFIPPSYGDITSPLSGIITCTESMSGSGVNNIRFRIVDTENLFNRIDFCGSLLEGQVLKFNNGYNNEWTCSVNGIPNTSMIYYVDYVEPCAVIPNISKLRFDLLCSGALNVKLTYHNLYIAV